MKTLQLDMMKKRLASLVLCAFAIIAVSGCTTAADLAAISAQKEIALTTIKANAEQNDKAAARRVDLALAREERLKAEAEARRVQAGALGWIADKADAGGKAAIGVSLAHQMSANAAPQPAIERELPAPAPMQVPQIQMPKSGAEQAKEWAGLGLQLFGIATNGYVAVKNISGQVAMNADNQKGQTDRQNGLVGGLVKLGETGINGTRDLGLGLGEDLKTVAIIPHDVTIVNGNGNGLNGSNVDNSVKTATAACPLTQNAAPGAPATTTGGTTPTTNSGTKPDANTANSPCTATAGK